ncbi:uncharacterized protein A4U43_C06F430 [Asparagus officinalis]|uniref:Uncharacterized protein n=1 Tax=Asparagus officinalis TaxID=4686 RepID=A0A5P1ELR9_ASPOF|nr:uncharacterized protein A4U43_C06F430 [Asparagus officinalis]
MGEIDGVSRVSESPNIASGNAVFDASQYEFFGKDVLEEVELGGLEDDGDDTGLVENGDKEYPFFAIKEEKEEGEGIGLLSEVDDLSRTFSKLNRTVSEPQGIRNVHGRGSFSREGSLNVEVKQEPDFSNWADQRMQNAENDHDSKKWSSQPYPFPPESKPLYRTSSYPQQPHTLNSHILIYSKTLSLSLFPFPDHPLSLPTLHRLDLLFPFLLQTYPISLPHIILHLDYLMVST